jgi:hypothetical protein
MENSRFIIGYHGCLEPRATEIITGAVSIADWPKSQNKWDWLGQGVYFWEHAPRRAMQWAVDTRTRALERGEQPGEAAVIGAVISLERCFDLTDVLSTEALAAAYEELVESYRERQRPLPQNKGDTPDRVRRELDCTVIEWLLSQAPTPVLSVRSPFLEGRPAFPGSRIMAESHIQIAVRDTSCIRGVFRPTF